MNPMLNLASLAGQLHVMNAHGLDAMIARLDADCLKDGYLQPMPAEYYAAWPQDSLTMWCVRRGFYCLPTVELIEFLRTEVVPGATIEIGAGHGVIGKALGIPSTDSKMQERPEIVAMYQALKQTVVSYPPHVEKLSADEALDKYTPEVVIAAWVTHRYDPSRHDHGGNADGVDELSMICRPHVRRYVFVGHERVHEKKFLLDVPHSLCKPPFLFSRALDARNVIWIWDRS